MPIHEVAIYAPAAACLYERKQEVTGGAERQTALLAAGLAGAGLDVAHIVLPVADPKPDLADGLTLVQRRLVSTRRGPIRRSAQLAQVWSALSEADAEIYVFRHSLAALGIAALYCRAHRRRLVFAASSDLDFSFDFFSGRRPELELYKLGVRGAGAVVIQTTSQEGLARDAFPRLSRVEEIASFAESAEPTSATPEAFLWTGRLDAIKQPLRYLELAEAVPEARFWMVVRQLDPERAGGSPGEGPEAGLEQQVYERAARLPNLELLDQRPHQEAMELVERSAAVVNTGPTEGMPNLFLEAWARGVPALTHSFDPDGRISRLGLGFAAGGSAEAFADGARRLWRERDERKELSLRVRSYLKAAHGVEAVTHRWVELIGELRRS